MKRNWVLPLFALALLGLASFAGMRWLGGGPGFAALLGGREVQLRRSDQLPSPEPDVTGILVRRDGNSLFAGTGNVKFQTVRENDLATPVFESSYDGPVVELVLTRDSQLFCDATGAEGGWERESADGFVDQVLRPATKDEIAGDRVLWAWGTRQGDRLLVTFLVIIPPPGGGGC